ncbi:MAG: VWA domain-containing protein [Treponema sp.]|nr:VWA domain-containing protein [Treponema sp.]
MNFGIEHPQALYALLLLIPCYFNMNKRFKRLVKEFSSAESSTVSREHIKRIKARFTLRMICVLCAWTMLIAAMAGFYWGTVSVPMQKSGREVAFVFDISYSMEATDAPGGMTRLESAANYASELLDHMQNVSVSVVLAKGEATVAIPVTEDYNAIRSLLSSLSPKLITSPGTSLGNGIQAALSSFPKESSRASCIWVFTDGEETDSSLAQVLAKTVDYGIPTAIIGFGSEHESSVMAGDGSTMVQTALRSKQIQKTIESVQKKAIKQKWANQPLLMFTDASEVGSAYRLMQYINPAQTEATASSASKENASDASVVYEVKSIPRNSLFTGLAILFFVLSFVFSEFNTLPQLSKKSSAKKGTLLATIVFTSLLTSCGGKFSNGTKILEGRLDYNRKDYQGAIANFLEAYDNAKVTGDQTSQEYALFGLASTYLMQDENESAVKRFEQISASAPENIRFSVYYNTGIIAHKNGDYAKAATMFKNALEIDSTNINAKINLELSLEENAVQARKSEQQLAPVTSEKEEASPLESAIYSLLREKETEQWKNSQKDSAERDSLDY